MTNSLTGLLGLTTGIMLARLLGPAGRGQLAAIQTWATTLGAIASLGVGEAIVYHCAKRPRDSASLVASGLVVVLSVAPFFVILGFGLMPYLLAAQTEETVQGARMYLLLIPLANSLDLLYQPLRAERAFLLWNLARLAPSLCWLAVVLLAWKTERAEAFFLAEMNLVFLFGLLILMFALVVPRLKGPKRPRISNCRDLLAFGLPTLATITPQLLNMRLDQMVLASLFGASDLGLYSVAVAWSLLMQPLLMALGSVLFPTIASETDGDERRRLLVRGSQAGSFCALGTGALVVAVTPIGVPLLFGEAFRPAVGAAAFLTVAGAIFWYRYILGEGLKGSGFPRKLVRAELVGLLGTILTLAALLPVMGIIGAALASVVGYATTFFILLGHVGKVTGQGRAVLLRPRIKEVRRLAKP